MDFDYSASVTHLRNIEISLGDDFALLGETDLHCYYLLVCNILMGTVRLVEFGPFIQEIDELPNKCTVQYRHMHYDDKKLAKEIDKFLKGHCLIYAELIDINEGLDLIRDIPKFIRKYTVEKKELRDKKTDKE